MGRVEEELEEAKAENEKLKSENRRKEESYESLKKTKKKLKSENRKNQQVCEILKKSQNEQMVQIQEAVLKIENRALQLMEKDTANDNLRVDSYMDQGQKIHAFQEEFKGLKGLLAVPEEKGMVNKELSPLLHLEEKNRKVKDQLQLKTEELDHLEQKNEQLGQQLSTSEKERGKEKSSLLDVIATLQDPSPSGADRMICEEMKFPAHQLDQEYQELLNKGAKSSLNKLKLKLRAMEHKYSDCSKALQSKEVEWSLEMEKLTSELNQCKSELEGKDKAIGELMVELESSCSLMMELQQNIKDTAEENLRMEKLKEELNTCRSELEHKDTLIDEMMLELESCHSLMTDMQNEEWSSKLQTTKSKFDQCMSELACKDKAIEELMEELESCHSLMTQLQLRVESSEMAQQLEKIRKDFNECRDESEIKDRAIEELMRELEDSHSLLMRLKLQNEEAEWCSHWAMMASRLDDCRPEIEDKDRTKEELLKELEDCHSQVMELMLQNEGTSVMLMVLKSGISEAPLKLISEEKENDKEREKKVKRYEVMLTESSSALEGANSELEDKICEVNEIEFELQIWKSFADRLRANLEENYGMRKELEASLLEETFKQEKNDPLTRDEKYSKVNSLQQQSVAPDQEQARERESGSSARD